MNPKIVALVPMKGNSERVPNKNLKLFDGKPLYHAIINKLLKSTLIEEIIINTDSQRIINDIERNYFDKIKIRVRPNEIRGDFVSMNKIIKDDLENSDGDIYIQTHSTNPLLEIKSLDKSINFMINSLKDQNILFDSIFSVTKVQSRFYNIDGKPINHNRNELLRTQDLPPIFEENSCFFIFTKDSFKNSGHKRIGIKSRMFEIDKIEAIDIDTIEDFIIAETIFKTRNKFWKQ